MVIGDARGYVKSMEAREALRREAARERAQQKGLPGSLTAGGQGPPVFRAQRCPPSLQSSGDGQVTAPQGLFGAPVKVSAVASSSSKPHEHISHLDDSVHEVKERKLTNKQCMSVSFCGFSPVPPARAGGRDIAPSQERPRRLQVDPRLAVGNGSVRLPTSRCPSFISCFVCRNGCATRQLATPQPFAPGFRC